VKEEEEEEEGETEESKWRRIDQEKFEIESE
jgi:hypothetical protein